MSTDIIRVNLEERAVVGKGLTKLRGEGQVPAVIHNHGKESLHVMGGMMELSKVFAQAGKHHPVELKIGGKQQLALIKDADFEPTKHRLRHVVFQSIKQNEATEAEIPVVFAEGVDVPAEKKSLLVLKQLDYVEVKALPRDLPDQLIVDPSSLADVGDNLTVADIKVPEGVTILTEPEQQIAVVEMPRDQIAEADAAAASLAEDAAGSSDEPTASEATKQAEPAGEESAEADEAKDK